MSCCNDKFTYKPSGDACWTKADGTKASIKEMSIFDCEGKPSGAYYHEAGSPETPLDTSSGSVVVGACVVAAPDVEWKQFCEELADGTTAKFLRRLTTHFDANGDPIDPISTSDFEIDGKTAYTVVDESKVDECDGCVPDAPVGLITDLAALYA